MVAAGLLGLAGVGPAAAHDVLIGTDPANGAVLTVAPTQVKLTFAEQALSIGTRMRVTGPGGVVVSGPPVQVVGSYVTQSLDSGLASGAYTVLWRVTSADGHPVSGTFSFTVARSSAAGSQPAVAPSAAAGGTTGGTTDGTSGTWSTAGVALVGGAALVVVLLGVLAMVFLVRRPGRSGPPRA